jgi:hypothetical protein
VFKPVQILFQLSVLQFEELLVGLDRRGLADGQLGHSLHFFLQITRLFFVSFHCIIELIDFPPVTLLYLLTQGQVVFQFVRFPVQVLEFSVEFLHLSFQVGNGLVLEFEREEIGGELVDGVLVLVDLLF